MQVMNSFMTTKVYKNDTMHIPRYHCLPNKYKKLLTPEVVLSAISGAQSGIDVCRVTSCNMCAQSSRELPISWASSTMHQLSDKTVGPLKQLIIMQSNSRVKTHNSILFEHFWLA